jgi:hypothetical protein
MNNPARPNDYFELELPGAWEPLDSSSPQLDGKDKKTQFSFSHGNQIK